MRFKTLAAATALVLSTGISAAVAMPIASGTLQMGFIAEYENAATGNPATVGTATGIDFATIPFGLNAGPTSSSNFGNFTVGFADGSFAAIGINSGDVGFIRDLVFAGPFPYPLPFFAVPSDGLFFHMTSMSVSFQSAQFLALEGNGFFINGTDQTEGTWLFTSQASAAPGFIFQWSAAAFPVDVPEPATVALLGMGLIGLGLARRRMSAKA